MINSGVVPNVFREHYTQVPLTEDHHAVVSSALLVRTNRSATQFACGQRGRTLTA
jgi:hypothetical protein